MLKHFQLEQLQKATNNFSQDYLVGSVAFGNIYRGTFDGEGTLAVKKTHTESYISTEEFENEIRLVSKVKHKNLVSLVGFCQGAGAKGANFLVYEYVSKYFSARLHHGEGRKELNMEAKSDDSHWSC